MIGYISKDMKVKCVAYRHSFTIEINGFLASAWLFPNSIVHFADWYVLCIHRIQMIFVQITPFMLSIPRIPSDLVFTYSFDHVDSMNSEN